MTDLQNDLYSEIKSLRDHCKKIEETGQKIQADLNRVYELHMKFLQATTWALSTGAGSSEKDGVFQLVYNVHPDQEPVYGPKKYNIEEAVIAAYEERHEPRPF